MHERVGEFVKECVKGIDFSGEHVLEIGSKNVNGSVRPLFTGVIYHGIDVLEGKDVDDIIDAKDYDGHEQFDCVVTTDALEHCPEPRTIIECAYRSLKSGGMLIVTAASDGRDPHKANGTEGEPIWEWYRNVPPRELSNDLEEVGFVRSEVRYIDRDVHAIAYK